jgi:DNA-binding Lrp family transcriptional regulator
MKTPSDDVRLFLTRIEPYVHSEGARNVLKISRNLSIPYGTLQFRMSRLKEQGISIVPVVDSSRLGLERYRVFFNAEIGRGNTNFVTFFDKLHELAGLHYFARSLLSQSFDSEFMIPHGREEQLKKFLGSLEEMGLIKGVEIRRILWKEILMMRTDCYDYQRGVWDVDFSTLSADPRSHSYAGVAKMGQQRATHLDYVDLLIVKTLQLDPWVKAIDLARTLKLSGSDVSYHMNKHVFGEGQVSGFRFKWVGTKDAWAKHSIVLLTFVFRSLGKELIRNAMSVFTSSPFTWNHMELEDGTYLAELLVPVAQFPETIRHISIKLLLANLKPDQVIYPDWSFSRNYTIPYFLFDKERGWLFDCETALERIIQTIASFEPRG